MPFGIANHKDIYTPRDLNIIAFDELEILKDGLQGVGSYGIVHKAIWKSRDNKVVAVKMFTDERNIDSWSAEVKELTKVSHENIVKLYGASLHIDTPYLVMEFAEGGSLANLLKNKTKSYSLEHACSWARQTAIGVEYLHNLKPKPITHRDLKPGNLLLCRKYRFIKICDFGTACTVKTQATSSVKGSSSYMAPEVIRGHKYKEKCDVYSWSITFWEILSRQKPYVQMANDYVVMWSVTEKRSRPPTLIDCPKIINDLIVSCWDENPNMRPSMSQVCEKMNLIWTILIGDLPTYHLDVGRHHSDSLSSNATTPSSLATTPTKIPSPNTENIVKFGLMNEKSNNLGTSFSTVADSQHLLSMQSNSTDNSIRYASSVANDSDNRPADINSPNQNLNDELAKQKIKLQYLEMRKQQLIDPKFQQTLNTIHPYEEFIKLKDEYKAKKEELKSLTSSTWCGTDENH